MLTGKAPMTKVAHEWLMADENYRTAYCAGHIFFDGEAVIGRCSDGTEVTLGLCTYKQDRDTLLRYLAANPTNNLW